MFTETLFGNTQKTLALLGNSHLMDEAYLAGGTACALQLGHRISVDFDFFTPKEFDAKKLIHDLQKLGNFEVDPLPFHSFQGIHITDLRDIAAMKIDAIGSRGIKRDFVDLYFICRSGLTLAEILRLYERKYGSLSSKKMHILKSLVYFNDAEVSEKPRMLKEVNWEKVKKYFEAEVRKLANK